MEDTSQNRAVLAIRVLVSDSSPIHTQLLAEALAKNPDFKITTANGSAELVSKATEAKPDVAVVSSYLDEDPTRGCGTIRRLGICGLNTRFVLLLDSTKRDAILEAFAAGARGIFHRHESLETLANCVRQIHAGQIWASAEQMSYAVEALASAPHIRAVNAQGVDLLSKRERDVVTSLAAGLSNREIGARLGLSQHTIKNYLLRIFDKLGVSTRVELLSRTLTPDASRPPIQSFVSSLLDKEGPDVGADVATYRHAAEQGLTRAQIKMAEIHLHGAGAERDPIAAYMWYLIAEKTNLGIQEKIATDKRKLAETLTTDQILEAQQRATLRLTAQSESSTGTSTSSGHHANTPGRM